MKVGLDTNVLISGIFWGGKPLAILEHWLKDKFFVLASKEILNEYLETVREFSVKSERPDLHLQWSLTLPAKTVLVSIRKKFKICRDPGDDKFLDCAVGGKAEYLVSGDRDLLALGHVMNIPIVPPAKFLLTLH